MVCSISLGSELLLPLCGVRAGVQWGCVGHLVGLLPPELRFVLKMGRVLWGTGRGSPGEHCFVPMHHLSNVPKVLVTLQRVSPNSGHCNTCMQGWGSQEAEQNPPVLEGASPCCTVQSSSWWGVTCIPCTPPKKPAAIESSGLFYDGKIPRPSSPCRSERGALPGSPLARCPHSPRVPPLHRRCHRRRRTSRAQRRASPSPPPKNSSPPRPPPTHTPLPLQL